MQERHDETGVGATIEVAVRQERVEMTMTETTATMKTRRTMATTATTMTTMAMTMAAAVIMATITKAATSKQ